MLSEAYSAWHCCLHESGKPLLMEVTKDRLPLPPVQLFRWRPRSARGCSHLASKPARVLYPHLLPKCFTCHTTTGLSVLKHGDLGPTLDFGSCCPLSLEPFFLRHSESVLPTCSGFRSTAFPVHPNHQAICSTSHNATSFRALSEPYLLSALPKISVLCEQNLTCLV